MASCFHLFSRDWNYIINTCICIIIIIIIIIIIVIQGPKLTVLCRGQVATEMEKSGRQKVVRKIFAS